MNPEMKAVRFCAKDGDEWKPIDLNFNYAFTEIGNRTNEIYFDDDEGVFEEGIAECAVYMLAHCAYEAKKIAQDEGFLKDFELIDAERYSITSEDIRNAIKRYGYDTVEIVLMALAMQLKEEEEANGEDQ